MAFLPATIDIGSHSCLLLIAQWEESPDGSRRLVAKVQKVEVCRLGEDIHAKGSISPERIASDSLLVPGLATGPVSHGS